MENWEDFTLEPEDVVSIFSGEPDFEMVSITLEKEEAGEEVMECEKIGGVTMIEKLLEEEESVQSTVDDQAFLLINESDCDIQCQNCEQLFTLTQFEEHECEYNEFRRKINEESDDEGISCSPILGSDEKEHPCISQLQENTIRMKKFIKEECKMVPSEPVVASKKEDGPHDCTVCNKVFVHHSGLLRHMEKHTLENLQRSHQNNSEHHDHDAVVLCTVCGRLFASPSIARQHLELDHQAATSSDCSSQPDEFIATERNFNATLDVLRQMAYGNENWDANPPRNYLKAVALTFVLQCEFCEFVFMDKQHLLMHTSCHNPKLGFICTRCEVNYHTSKDILAHWQFDCPFMREATEEQIKLQKFFLCNVCDTKFATLDSLYTHRYKTVHLFPRLCYDDQTLMIMCECCGLLCSSAGQLMKHYEEKHMRKPKKDTAPKGRLYLCDVCGKSYTQSSHLWQHLRFHQGVKPFMCREEGCNRRFTIRPDLNDHIRKCHTGERPYHCTECGKRFLTGSVYYQHRLIHRGERRYGCDVCGRRFYRADALKNHERIHTGEKPFGCKFCEKKFRQRGDCDKHTKARHGIAKNSGQQVDENSKKTKESAAQASPAVVSPVYIGNLALPKSMFIPLLDDVEEVEE